MSDEYVRSTPGERALAWWAILTFGVFAVTGLVLAGSYTAVADTCDEFHESANTAVGWSIVIGAMALMAIIALRLRPRWWPLLTGVAMWLHLSVYWWLITPAGNC